MNEEIAAQIGGMAVFIGALVRAMKSEKAPRWVKKIPPNKRPRVAFLLGCIASFLEAIARNTPWKQSLFKGVFASALAVLGHELLIEDARSGKEVGGGGGDNRGPMTDKPKDKT